MTMTYILPLLLTIVPITVEPYPHSEACEEITVILYEAVTEGLIDQKQAAEITARCPQNL